MVFERRLAGPTEAPRSCGDAEAGAVGFGGQLNPPLPGKARVSLKPPRLLSPAAKSVPLPAGGRGLFLLAVAGLVSRTKRLYFLLIKLSPGDTSVPARLAAFIRGEDGAVLLSAPMLMQNTSARQGYSDIKGRD